LGAKQFAGDQEACFDRATTIYSEVLPGLTGLEKAKAEKGFETILASANARGQAGSSWVVIFRSADPTVWNTDSRTSATSFAIPLTAVPATMRFVRLRRINGEAVIMPLTKAVIGKEWKGEAHGWQGEGKEILGAKMLGIFDTRHNVDGQIGEVAVYGVGRTSFTGWGFGHRVRHGGPSQACWNGEWIPLEPLEVAVTARNLTSAERAALVP
jgi:hypothetical protein